MVIAVVGWIAAVLVVVAYAMTATGRVRASAPWCLAVNLVGSGGLVISCAVAGAWPSAALNVAWGGAALVGLARSGPGRAARNHRRGDGPHDDHDSEEVSGGARSAL